MECIHSSGLWFQVSWQFGLWFHDLEKTDRWVAAWTCVFISKGTSIQKWSHCESNKRDLTCKNRCFEIYVLVSKFGFEASPSVGIPNRLSWERHSCRGAEEIFKVQPGTGSKSKMSAQNQSTSNTATNPCNRYMINLDSLIFVISGHDQKRPTPLRIVENIPSQFGTSLASIKNPSQNIRTNPRTKPALPSGNQTYQTLPWTSPHLEMIIMHIPASSNVCKIIALSGIIAGDMFFRLWASFVFSPFAHVCRCWNGEQTKRNSEKTRRNGEKNKNPKCEDWNSEQQLETAIF